MRRSLAVILLSCVALSACGSAKGPMSDIKVTSAKHPKITVAHKVSVTKTTTAIVTKGRGRTARPGDLVRVNYVAASGTSGKTFDDSFKTGTPTYAALDKGRTIPGFLKGLVGQKEGSRVKAAVPPADGIDAMNPQFVQQTGLTATDTVVFVFDVDKVIPKGFDVKGARAAVDPKAPTVEIRNGRPTGIHAGPATPQKEAAYILESGRGAKVTKNGVAAAQYFGQVWPDGRVFDQSWTSGSAFGTAVSSGVIKCWSDLLPGLTVGTRAVLVCPKEVAYGDSPDSELKDDTLMFVIDVVDAD